MPPTAPPASGPPERATAIPREGRAFRVLPEQSLLTVLVFRGGALARAGHNHLIASRSMEGTAWVPDDPMRASFEIRVPVLDLTIDEPQLRAEEGPEFSSDVPDSAREGTRRNMLSEALLDGERFPHIVLRAAGLERGPDGLLANVLVTVRDQTRIIATPLQYELEGDALHVHGELSLKQTELGLTPFSLFGGALRVEDGMIVRFSVRARGE